MKIKIVQLNPKIVQMNALFQSWVRLRQFLGRALRLLVQMNINSSNDPKNCNFRHFLNLGFLLSWVFCFGAICYIGSFVIGHFVFGRFVSLFLFLAKSFNTP